MTHKEEILLLLLLLTFCFVEEDDGDKKTDWKGPVGKGIFSKIGKNCKKTQELQPADREFYFWQIVAKARIIANWLSKFLEKTVP